MVKTVEPGAGQTLLCLGPELGLGQSPLRTLGLGPKSVDRAQTLK